MSQEELAVDIHSTGFFNNKAKSVTGAAKKIIHEFGGQVPRTIEELVTVPGAARKTANVVLGTCFGIASGVVVDTHVQRISRRLDLTKQSDPVKIEQALPYGLAFSMAIASSNVSTRNTAKTGPNISSLTQAALRSSRSINVGPT